MLKVVIIGAGAIGKCFAALLAGRAAVVMYERNRWTSLALKKGYFIFEENKRTKRIKVRMISSLRELQGEKIDLLIFATKVMDLRAAVTEAAMLEPRCVFFPQNGIFDMRWATRFLKTADICRGATTMACQEICPTRVTLFYRGNMYVGGDGAPLVAGLFRKCGIMARAYRDSKGSVWAKLIFSAVMNPLPIMAGKGYDILKRDQKIWQLVRRAVAEGRSVARALGVRLAFDPLHLMRRVRNGDLAGIPHRGTIFHDFQAGRATEIDFITGALVRQACKAGVRTPALDMILNKAKAAGA